MHICTARLLRTQILVQGAMDNATAPCCGTDLVDFVTTTLSSAQLQSPPLPKTVLCICENPTVLMQVKGSTFWERAGTTQALLTTTCHLMRNTDDYIPAFTMILAIFTLCCQGTYL